LVAFGAANGSAQFLARPQVMLGREVARGRSKTVSIVWESPVESGLWTVRWVQARGEAISASKIEYRNVAVPDITPHRVFNATLSGLAAGLPFNYDILLDDRVVFSSAAMAPKSAEQPFRIVAFGNPADGSRNLKSLVYRTYELRPDFLMLVGNIVPSQGKMTDYMNRFWPTMNTNQAATTVGAPILRSTLTVAVPGPNDTRARDLRLVPDALAFYPYWIQPDNGPRKVMPILGRTTALRNAAGPSFGRGGTFSFEYGNAHVTVLDSGFGGQWSSDVELRQWLEADLARASKAKWRFVALAGSPYASATKATVSPVRALAKDFDRLHVDLVISSEQQNYQRSYPISAAGIDKSFDGKLKRRAKGPIYIVSGAAVDEPGDAILDAKHRLPFTARFVAVPSLTTVDVAGGTLLLRQIDTYGNEIDRIRIEK
jgi:acid phosphatase type 7